MRTDSIQLPSYEELNKILQQESQRKIVNKETFVTFDTIKNVLKDSRIEDTFFSNRNTKISNKLLLSATQIINKLGEKILNNQVDETLLQKMYLYLAEEDVREKVDLLFIFGSQSTLRAQKAIELYDNGYSDKIRVSGKSPFYKKNKISEAETIINYLVNNGINNENLYQENKSITIPDNCKRSIDSREKKHSLPKSIILINSPFSQRRGRGHMKKFINKDTKLIRQNSFVSQNYSLTHRHKNKIGIKIVLNEFIKMRIGQILNTI